MTSAPSKQICMEENVDLRRLRILRSSHAHAHARTARWLHMSQVVLMAMLGIVVAPTGPWVTMGAGVVGIVVLCGQIMSNLHQTCMDYWANSMYLSRVLESECCGVPEQAARVGAYLPTPSEHDVELAGLRVGRSMSAAEGETHTPVTFHPAKPS